MMIVLQPVGTSRPLSSLMGGALFVTGSPMFITGELLYASTDVTLVVRSPDKSRNDLAFDRESGRG